MLVEKTFPNLKVEEKYSGVIVYDDSTTEKARFMRESSGTLFVYRTGYRRYGYRTCPINGVLRFRGKTIVEFKVPAEVSYCEKYANDLLKWKRYILKHLAEGVWPNLREDAEKITEEKIALLKKCDADADVHKAAADIGLPYIERYKSITLTSCEIPSGIHKRIKEAIRNKKDFDESWRGRYDYSARGKTCEDGSYRMWFSAEYRGLGNGHYYLLLDDNHAIFIEDD